MIKETYTSEMILDVKKLMKKKMKTKKDNCYYIGNLKVGLLDEDYYNCFGLITTVDESFISFIGEKENIKASEKRLEKILGIKLINWNDN